MTPKEERPRGLGRGLSALIGDEAMPTRGEVPAKGSRTLPIAFLKPGRFQPRKDFAYDALAELAASIREKGVLTPILVRPLGPDSYEIVAGERRWRAAQLAKLHDVPVVVRDLADAEALEIAIIENVQRADLNVLEEAAAYQELMERFHRTQEQIAQQVGKSRPHVANTVRLLRLPQPVQVWLREGKLTAGHARTLLNSHHPEKVAIEIMAGQMTVRQAERRSIKTKIIIPKDPNLADLEASISNKLGLKIQIIHKGDKGGEVRIAYSSLEQLEEITRRLNRS